MEKTPPPPATATNDAARKQAADNKKRPTHTLRARFKPFLKGRHPDSFSDYPDHEEMIHVLTHALGAVLAVIAAIVLLMRAVEIGGAKEIVAVSLYGASMIILYLSSSIYHGSYRWRHFKFMEMLDHSAIYIKIAGSYTPFALLILSPALGTTLLILVWVIAIGGVIFKVTAHFLSDMRKYDWISLIGYLAMGWLAVFFVGDLWKNMPHAGFWWLVAGGMSFSIGAIFYKWKSLPYTHAIFHIFVLGGSISHFIAVYVYVLPNPSLT